MKSTLVIFRTITLVVVYGFVHTANASSDIELGRAIAFDRSKGNCLACHAMAGGESPGNIGPALSDMRTRYPDSRVLRDRIWDETAFNPLSVMPPFGKHGILSEEEIDLVLEFVYSL